MALFIYYDGECPLCTRYVTMVRLERQQSVSLINLREDQEASARLRANGFDIDQGMVVDQDGRLSGGADATTTLALLSTGSDWLNALNRTLLGNPVVAKVIYPLLRAGRWLLLLILGRELMSAGERHSARQTIFAICFALFSILHFCNYATAYGRFPPGWDQIALLAGAIALLFRPQSSRLLLFLMFVSLVSAYVQAPAQSNHTITRNFLLLGYWLSFVAAIIRNRPASEIFNNFALSGQAVLIVMYVFGIFHKLNTDFLNPATSCAVALWKMMPQPISLLEGRIIDYLAIYGTFAAEGAILAALLIRRLRHYGIAAGIAFHLLLALSSYAMYIAFTMLSIAMHSLFLSDGAAEKIAQSTPMVAVRNRMRDPAYVVGAIILFLLLGLLAFNGAYGAASLMAMPVVLPFCWIILRYGRSERPLSQANRTAWSIGLVTFAAFFANCSMPYLGLKSAQTLNMFANLRLEAGVSNHLVFYGGDRPFKYLDHVAQLEGGGSDPELWASYRRGFGVVYYDVLASLADRPGETLTFVVDGKRYTQVSSQDMRSEIAMTLHPQWFRKWFHFQPVQLETPERCSI